MIYILYVVFYVANSWCQHNTVHLIYVGQWPSDSVTVESAVSALLEHMSLHQYCAVRVKVIYFNRGRIQTKHYFLES